MFDIFDNDYFIMILEVVCLYFIIHDIRAYNQTKQNQYLLNIALAIGFFIWTAIPFYNKYYGWNDTQKQEFVNICHKTEKKELCECYSDKIFKEYNYDKFNLLYVQKEPKLKEFRDESIKECEEKLKDD
jgi:hypothetical protein